LLVEILEKQAQETEGGGRVWARSLKPRAAASPQHHVAVTVDMFPLFFGEELEFLLHVSSGSEDTEE
jgi:hypothetical protein